MKLGTGNKSLPRRAAEDVARAMEKAVQSLADKHGVDLNEVARENDAAADAVDESQAFGVDPLSAASSSGPLDDPLSSKSPTDDPLSRWIPRFVGLL